MTKTLANLMIMYDQRISTSTSSINKSSTTSSETSHSVDKKKNNSLKDVTNHCDLLCNENCIEPSKSYPITRLSKTFREENKHSVDVSQKVCIKQESTDTSPSPEKASSKTDNFIPSTELRENSNIIKIHPSDDMNSIWRGLVWSKVKFNINLDKHFLPNQRGEVSNYVLVVLLERKTNYGGSALLNPSTCIGLKMQFERNGIKDSCRASIDTNPYNSVQLTIHQDFFNAGEEFSLIVQALKVKHDPADMIEPTYFGRSNNIIVTNYAFSIEHHFEKHPYVEKSVGKQEYVWYNKCGGDSSGLEVLIHLRDEKGDVVNDIGEAIHLRTELVYSDGSPTPYMPLNPLKNRSTKLPLYHPLVPEPTLEPGNGSASFKFRIEEVSFHQPNQSGFRLKVSHFNTASFTVHTGLLEDSIIVFSKPKFLPKKTANKERCLNNHVSFSLAQIVQCFLEDDKCRCCGNCMKTDEIHVKSKHVSSCLFAGDFSSLANLLNFKPEYDSISSVSKSPALSRKRSKSETNPRTSSVKGRAVCAGNKKTEDTTRELPNTIPLPQEIKDSRTHPIISYKHIHPPSATRTDIPEQVFKRVSLGHEDHHLFNHFGGTSNLKDSNTSIDMLPQFKSDHTSHSSDYDEARPSSLDNIYNPMTLRTINYPENNLKTVSPVFDDQPLIELQVAPIQHSPIQSRQKNFSFERSINFEKYVKGPLIGCDIDFMENQKVFNDLDLTMGDIMMQDSVVGDQFMSPFTP